MYAERMNVIVRCIIISFSIEQATSGNYIFLPVIQPELKQLFEGMKHSARSHQDGSDRATQINDVGINFVTTLKNRNIVGWSFIFILENSPSSSTKKMMPTSDLYCRYIDTQQRSRRRKYLFPPCPL